LLLKQNIIGFFIVITWFLANYLIFIIISGDYFRSLLIIFFFDKHDSNYGNFYAAFSDFVIFGIVFSVITVGLFRRYNPVEACRELAGHYRNHAVVIGYNHIGQRIIKYLREFMGLDVVVVDFDRETIVELIENGEPVVNDNALYIETLEDAGVSNAKAVFVMSDNLELLMVVCANVRELNDKCKLICRIFEDDFAEVISKTYNAQIISTSKYSADVILEKIEKGNYKNILLVGLNHITARLIKKLKESPEIKFQCIEEDEEVIEDMAIDDFCFVVGDPKEISVLEQVKLNEIDCVINVNKDVTCNILITRRIRDLNPSCKIIARFFNDSVAEILEQPPFNVEVISSSKEALEIMVSKGLLNF